MILSHTSKSFNKMGKYGKDYRRYSKFVFQNKCTTLGTSLCCAGMQKMQGCSSLLKWNWCRITYAEHDIHTLPEIFKAKKNSIRTKYLYVVHVWNPRNLYSILIKVLKYCNQSTKEGSVSFFETNWHKGSFKKIFNRFNL